MKELLYLPPLIVALLGAVVLVTRIRPMRELWPVIQPLLLCGIVAMAPRDVWWILLVAWIAVPVSLYLAVRLLGPLMVAVAVGVSGVIYALFPEYNLWFVGSYAVVYVIAMFAWATAPRAIGEQKLWGRFWK